MSSPSRAAAVATDGPRGPARTPFVLRVPLAVASGLLLWLAFPTHDLWWAAPLGVTAFTAATLGTTLPRAFLLGLAGGLAVFVPTLSWSGIYVGVLPWLALATTESLYVAVMALVTTWVWRRLDRAGRPGLGYVAVPVGWVLQELVRGSLPVRGLPVGPARVQPGRRAARRGSPRTVAPRSSPSPSPPPEPPSSPSSPRCVRSPPAPSSSRSCSRSPPPSWAPSSDSRSTVDTSGSLSSRATCPSPA